MNEIDLTKFCDRDATRYDIRAPWVKDGWEYAVDGKIGIRIATGKPNNSDGLRVPKMDGIFPTEELDWQAITLEVPDCSECKNTGFIPEQDCQDCDGDGWVQHSCDCEYCTEETEDCETCDGEGVVTDSTCEFCYRSSIDIYGHSIAYHYARLMRDLPNIKFAKFGYCVAGKFDGGIVVCLNRNEVDK